MSPVQSTNAGSNGRGLRMQMHLQSLPIQAVTLIYLVEGVVRFGIRTKSASTADENRSASAFHSI